MINWNISKFLSTFKQEIHYVLRITVVWIFPCLKTAPLFYEAEKYKKEIKPQQEIEFAPYLMHGEKVDH